MNPSFSLLRSVLAPCFRLIAISAAAAVLARAAETPGAASASVPANEDPGSPGAAIQLSPFQVNTSRDVGFVAASSLAGGRLASDLNDTAAAYSVLTREFVDALGIIDLSEATKWTVNTSTTQDDGGNDLIARSVNYSSRGIGANAQLRNFFPSTFNPDSYNIDRYDYARGPNAILFGPGGIGGTANVVTKQPLFGQRKTELGWQLGSWRRNRLTGDTNIPLGSSIALRLNGLLQDSQGWQQNVFDRRHALDLDLAWAPVKPLKLTIDGEWGHTERNVPITSVLDIFSAWDGTTVFPGPVASISTPVATASGAQRFAPPHLLVAPALTGGMALLDYGNDVHTRGGDQAAGLSVGGVPVASTLTPSIANFGMLNAVNLPPWNVRLAPIFNSPIVPQVTKDFLRGLNQPRSTFSEDVNTPNFFYKYRTFSGAAEYHLGEHLFLEFAGNYLWQFWDSDLTARSFMEQMLIDLSATLPNGQPNPGYLQPFSENSRLLATQESSQVNYRAAAAYVLNNTRAGNFKFNLMGGTQYAKNDTRQWEYTLAGLSDDPRTWGASSTINGVAVDPRIYVRYYWTLNGPNNRPLAQPFTGDASSVTVNLNGKNYTGKPGWLLNTSTLAALGTRTITDLEYVQAAFNWNFWKNRVNVFGSARDDIYKSWQRTPPQALTDPAYGPGWDGITVPFRPAAPANYNNLSAAEQAKYSPASVSVTQTTYAIGSVVHATRWLSPFADFGTSFNPNGTGIDIYNNIFPPRTSRGWDAGLRFNLGHGRVVASVSRYAGREKNQLINVGAAAGLSFALDGQLMNIIGARPVGAGTAGNIRGLPQVPRAYGDSRDQASHGYEAEITANLARGWRFMGNVAFPVASQTNAYAETRAYLQKNDAVLRQILNDAGVSITANNQAIVNPVASPDAVNAATGWNNLQAFKAAVISGEQKVNRLPQVTANLFTDYTMPDGRLRGLRMGGGVNFRGKEIIGNHGADVIADPAHPGQSIQDPSASALNYVYGKSYYTATATLGYTLRLKEHYQLSFTLRIDNLLDEHAVHYYDTVQRPPGGDLSSYARVATPYQFFYNQPRNVSLTTTLRF